MEPTADLDALTESIAADPELLRSLAVLRTAEEFAAACAAAAAARGLRVSAQEVRDLVRERGIRWLERNAR